MPPLLVGTLVLGVVMGAYMTEVLRGAILAVPQGIQGTPVQRVGRTTQVQPGARMG